MGFSILEIRNLGNLLNSLSVDQIDFDFKIGSFSEELPAKIKVFQEKIPPKFSSPCPDFIFP